MNSVFGFRSFPFSKSLVTATLLLGAAAPAAHAHLGYTGRDFGSFTGLSYGSSTISNQAITGNYGWADAADGVLGDSHKARAFRFHLDNDAYVSFSFSANPTATATSVGGLIPGFSVYQGLAATAPFATSQTALPSSADHDFSDSSVAWRTAWAKDNLGVSYDYTATDGSWNALGTWKIGGDGDLPGDFSQLSTFTFKGFGVDFDKDGTATAGFRLSKGDYTVLVGGNDIANKLSTSAGSAFGVSGTITVTAVPEPTLLALATAGATLMVVFSSRNKR
jgi:hypothetical protein